MSPGEVNLKLVGERLGYFQSRLEDLRSLPLKSLAEFSSDPRNPAAAESFLRRAIEGLLDTARHLLAKAHGLGTMEYRQVARQAGERGLIKDGQLAARFERIAGFRNRLTHFYDEVTPRELFELLAHHLSDLEVIAQELRHSAAELSRKGHRYQWPPG
ncbi:MAG TPA: DUF86 domain-containing protein [Acidobacteriota bacterium]|jgi:uncharacterized protein YutE (UPF0331/DUF86 family)